jgi:hypothetical protein
MADPTKDPEFQRVLGNLIKMKPKLHSEMKLGKRSKRKSATGRKKKRKKI